MFPLVETAEFVLAGALTVVGSSLSFPPGWRIGTQRDHAPAATTNAHAAPPPPAAAAAAAAAVVAAASAGAAWRACPVSRYVDIDVVTQTSGVQLGEGFRPYVSVTQENPSGASPVVIVVVVAVLCVCATLRSGLPLDQSLGHNMCALPCLCRVASLVIAVVVVSSSSSSSSLPSSPP